MNNPQDKDILVNLYPNDSGDESPNFANYFIFEKYEIFSFYQITEIFKLI
jgi:hypothetical protein